MSTKITWRCDSPTLHTGHLAGAIVAKIRTAHYFYKLEIMGREHHYNFMIFDNAKKAADEEIIQWLKIAAHEVSER